jgi:hypothetical protein
MEDGYEHYASPKKEKSVWRPKHFVGSRSGRSGLGPNRGSHFALLLAILMNQPIAAAIPVIPSGARDLLFRS